MGGFLILILVSFLLGSIPSGYLVGKYYGRDIRAEGSGNTGATNTARVLGKKAGITTLIVDVLKGAIATLLPLIFDIGQLQWTEVGAAEFRGFQAIFGFSAILGHCYSPFLKFKGGKGVATSLGVFLIIDWVAILLVIGIFIGVVKYSRYVSLASIVAAISLPVLMTLGIGLEQHGLTKMLAIFTAYIILRRHGENISRLIAGKETKISIES